MNTYELLILTEFGDEWVEITGNTPQEAVDTFRLWREETVFVVRDADSKESVGDWE